MIRDFSEEKKQEIFRILDEIDMKDWKPFMEWCGSKAEEFGDWPEKLGISKYTRYVDEYQQSILDLNERARQQLNTVFENVAEIDKRYAEQMRECQEELKEQIAMLHKMTEFMQSLADGGTNIDVITKGNTNEGDHAEEERKKENKEVVFSGHGREETREVMPGQETGFVSAGVATVLEEDIEGRSVVLAYQNKLESGEEILKSYLITEDITDSNEQEVICNVIKEFQPQMLINLYNANCNSVGTVEESTKEAVEVIMGYYGSHYFGKYPYPLVYIEGIIKGYETHRIEKDRFVLDNGGNTIAYGHDVRNGEDFTNGLNMEEGLKLAISDLDEKYEDIILCISEINDMNGMKISINDFTENQIIFLLDFSYNRGRGMMERPDKDENGNSQVHSSLAILIIAVWEKDYETIIYTLGEETKSMSGEYYEGLELRRMDEYEILTMGDYEKNDEIERECNGWVESIYRP